ncbi:MAG: hypothetical protein WCK58_14550 [Chloroflexota bacterium]
MAEPMNQPITRCPWCSAELSIPGAEQCLACGAALVSVSGGPDPEIRGVTTLDPEAILRARAEVARPRNRILSFITGDVAVESSGTASAESLAPPPDEVRREMLRLEHDAEQRRLRADTVALKTEALARRGLTLADLAAADAAAAAAAPAAPAAPAEPGRTEPDAS